MGPDTQDPDPVATATNLLRQALHVHRFAPSNGSAVKLAGAAAASAFEAGYSHLCWMTPELVSESNRPVWEAFRTAWFVAAGMTSVLPTEAN